MKTHLELGNITNGAGGSSLRKAALAVALLLCGCLNPVNAGDTLPPALPDEGADTLAVRILFPVGVSEVQPAFADNSARLDAFMQRLQWVEENPSCRLSGMRITGFASPEGGYNLNRRLARERAENLAAYINENHGVPDSIIDVHSSGIDWQGLDKAMGESGIPGAQRVQYIIRNQPEFTYDRKGNLVGSRKKTLMELDGGRVWGRMMEEVYPALRSSASMVCYFESVAPAIASGVAAEEPQPEKLAADSLTLQAESPAPAPAKAKVEYLRYPLFALRSNLLVPLMNIGIEVPVARHWSVGADYYYPWIWPAKSNKNCFELIFISAEVRYWLNANRKRQIPDKNYLTGHSFGLYGAWGYYDFEHNYHGHQGDGWSVGVDYQFALPVAKGKLRLEFELAVGVVNSPNVQPYNVLERGGHLFRETGHTKTFTYFGPTKASVSLVVPINRKIRKPESTMP